jgi:hypothetical protein
MLADGATNPDLAKLHLSAIVMSVGIPRLHKRIERIKFLMENWEVVYVPAR